MFIMWQMKLPNISFANKPAFNLKKSQKLFGLVNSFGSKIFMLKRSCYLQDRWRDVQC